MELLGIFGLLYATTSALAWYFIAPVVILILFAIVFSNDNNVGGEAWIFVVIFGAIGYALWGQITISQAILGSIYYLAIGSVWSIFNYAINIKEEMAKAKKDGATAKTHDMSYYRKKIRNERIAMWILWFPFSMIEYILGNFLGNILKYLVRHLGGVYNKITQHYFEKFFG